jgi:hypothetical protein
MMASREARYAATRSVPLAGTQAREPYSNDRSRSSRSRHGDRAAQLTHEDSHVAGTPPLGKLHRILVLHTRAVIGDGQLYLIVDLFQAQHDMSCLAGESVLDGVRRQLVDQEAEGYSTTRVDIQRFGLDLYLNARRLSKQAALFGFFM